MSANQQSSEMDKSSLDFTEANLIDIKNLISQRGDNDGYTPNFLQVIADKIDYKLEQIRKREEELKRKRTVPEEVNDFSIVNRGTLVKDCGPGTFGVTRTGIVVDFTYFKDDLCGVIVWPVIHWEGHQLPSLTHPGRATLHNGQTMRKIVMNANQQEEEVDVLEAIEILESNKS